MDDELGALVAARFPALTHVPSGHMHCLRVEAPDDTVTMLFPDKSAQTSQNSAPGLSENLELGHRWQRVEAA